MTACPPEQGWTEVKEKGKDKGAAGPNLKQPAKSRRAAAARQLPVPATAKTSFRSTQKPQKVREFPQWQPFSSKSPFLGMKVDERQLDHNYAASCRLDLIALLNLGNVNSRIRQTS